MISETLRRFYFLVKTNNICFVVPYYYSDNEYEITRVFAVCGLINGVSNYQNKKIIPFFLPSFVNCGGDNNVLRSPSRKFELKLFKYNIYTN